MRLNQFNQVPREYNAQTFTRIIQNIENQLNNLSEGIMTAKTNALTAAPTTGTYAVGDFVANSAPSELGGVGSKYLILGWCCTVAPGTFLACRVLTGN